LVMQQIKDHTIKIALALETVGLMNIQFAIKNDIVYIIEANPRASRTVPFICKAYG
jgi:carbamoyl-phosphate synthase large subunit